MGRALVSPTLVVSKRLSVCLSRMFYRIPAHDFDFCANLNSQSRVLNCQAITKMIFLSKFFCCTSCSQLQMRYQLELRKTFMFLLRTSEMQRQLKRCILFGEVFVVILHEARSPWIPCRRHVCVCVCVCVCACVVCVCVCVCVVCA